MYHNLIDDGRKAGFERFAVRALVRNGEQILLVERPDGVYELVGAEVKEGEALAQALLRILMEKVGGTLKEVTGYLGHVDLERVRQFDFGVTLEEPYDVTANEHIAFAWVTKDQAMGYPITDELREMLTSRGGL